MLTSTSISNGTLSILNQALGTSYVRGEIVSPACALPLVYQQPLSARTLLDSLPEEAKDLMLLSMPHSQGDTLDFIRILYRKADLTPVAVVVF
jgi:hypothetical protein